MTHYSPSVRYDGKYEIFLYPDDPAFKLAERLLKGHNFTALSAGKVFVGTEEDFAGFAAELAVNRNVSRSVSQYNA